MLWSNHLEQRSKVRQGKVQVGAYQGVWVDLTCQWRGYDQLGEPRNERLLRHASDRRGTGRHRKDNGG
jgi:hypothetical protein